MADSSQFEYAFFQKISKNFIGSTYIKALKVKVKNKIYQNFI